MSKHARLLTLEQDVASSAKLSLILSIYSITRRSYDTYAVGSHTLPTIGDLVCDGIVNGKHFAIDMVVSTENESIGCILGMDFLLEHECDLAIKTGRLFIDNMKVKLRKESSTKEIACK